MLNSFFYLVCILIVSTLAAQLTYLLILNFYTMYLISIQSKLNQQPPFQFFCSPDSLMQVFKDYDSDDLLVIVQHIKSFKPKQNESAD